MWACMWNLSGGLVLMLMRADIVIGEMVVVAVVGWCPLLIPSAKILELEGSISPSIFYRQLPDYWSHVFILIYPVDEFSLVEMKMWIKRIRRQGEFKIPLSNPSGENLLRQNSLRQSSSVKTGAPLGWSFSVKTGSGLNTLTVSAKKVHDRPQTGCQMLIRLEIL